MHECRGLRLTFNQDSGEPPSLSAGRDRPGERLGTTHTTRITTRLAAHIPRAVKLYDWKQLPTSVPRYACLPVQVFLPQRAKLFLFGVGRVPLLGKLTVPLHSFCCTKKRKGVCGRLSSLPVRQRRGLLKGYDEDSHRLRKDRESLEGYNAIIGLSCAWAILIFTIPLSTLPGQQACGRTCE